MSSLRTRLYLGLVAILLVAGIAGALTAFRWAYNEADEFQDSILEQVGRFAASNRLRPGPDAGPEISAEARVFVEELSEASANSTGVLAPLPADLSDGLHTLQRNGQSWRVLLLTRADGSRAAVAQSTAYRDEVAGDSAWRAVMLLAALIPVLMVLVGLVIRQSFRPVLRLAAQLDAKKKDHLAALPTVGLPQELLPFIESINRLLVRVGAMFDQQKRFVADAAHELRSPITALSLQADNLDRPDLPQESRQRLATLQTGIRRAAHLLEQLLALSRYESNGASPKSSPAAFDTIAKAVIAELLPEANRRGVDLGFSRLDPLSIKADGTAIAVLVRNLADNALRHTPSGGKIDVSLVHESESAVFRVEDTGPGVPESEMARVLEPFYRGEWSIEEGTGLGLSIAQRISASFGGAIALKNLPDRRGFRVSIVIPATAIGDTPSLSVPRP